MSGSSVPATSVLIASAVCVALAALVFWARMPGPHTSSPSAIAKTIVAACAQSAEERSTCYEQAVPALYPAVPMTQLFDVVRTIRAQDSTYQFCHVLAHKLGQRMVAEDPAKWLDAISINPVDGLCSNGFIHGVIIGRFNSGILDDATLGALIPDFQKACEPRADWQPSPLDQGMCYHGLGHLFDYVTNADLAKALSLCEQVVRGQTGDWGDVCYEGVFMQIFQPLEPEDFALVERLPVTPTVQNIRSFCSAFGAPRHVGACLRESWPLFTDDILSGVGAQTLCSDQPGPDMVKRCYEAVSSIVGRILLGSNDQVIAACNQFPPQWQSTCYSASAAAILEENRTDASAAVVLCTEAEPVVGDACVQELAARARFIFGENMGQRTAFCEKLPAYTRKTCLAN